MKWLLIVFVYLIACSSSRFLRTSMIEKSLDMIQFHISTDSFDQNKLWVNVYHIADSDTTVVLDPAVYPITYLRIFSKSGKELSPTKFKFNLDLNKAFIHLNPKQSYKKPLNMRLNVLFPNIEVEGWSKIIAAYQPNIRSLKMLSDTIINTKP